MNLRGRLDRLAKWADSLGLDRENEPDVEWSDDMRVCALRNISGRMSNGADPFPDLEGANYLAAWLPWFLIEGERWSEWAQLAGLRFSNAIHAALGS